MSTKEIRDLLPEEGQAIIDAISSRYGTQSDGQYRIGKGQTSGGEFDISLEFPNGYGVNIYNYGQRTPACPYSVTMMYLDPQTGELEMDDNSLTKIEGDPGYLEVEEVMHLVDQARARNTWPAFAKVYKEKHNMSEELKHLQDKTLNKYDTIHPTDEDVVDNYAQAKEIEPMIINAEKEQSVKAPVSMDKKSFVERAKNNVKTHKKAYISAGVASAAVGAGAGYMITKYGAKQALNVTQYFAKKYLPAGLAVAGATGLIATAVLAYKAAPKVNLALDQIEEDRAKGKKVSSIEAIRMISGPLWKPIVVGTGSLTALAGSYYILNGRINSLSKLASQQANALREGMSPVENKTITDEDGNEEEIAVEVDAAKNDQMGRWMHYSDEWTQDDLSYVTTLIDSVETRMQDRLFERGYLVMNEVLEALGFQRTAQGAILGWTTADTFYLDKKMFNGYHEADGDEASEIFVQWTPAHSVYDKVSFTGRYALGND